MVYLLPVKKLFCLLKTENTEIGYSSKNSIPVNSIIAFTIHKKCLDVF